MCMVQFGSVDGTILLDIERVNPSQRQTMRPYFRSVFNEVMPHFSPVN